MICISSYQSEIILNQYGIYIYIYYKAKWLWKKKIFLCVLNKLEVGTNTYKVGKLTPKEVMG